MKRLITLSLVLAVVLSLCLPVMPAVAAQGQNSSDYYYNQLTTADARAIYSAMSAMLQDGSLKTGSRSIDLVQNGTLEDRTYIKNALMADFSSAKDAFMLDHSDVFYVDFDKLSLTYTQGADGSVSILLGVGRDSNYFRKGFNRSNVAGFVAAFDTQVNTIAAQAGSKETLEEQLKVAYDAVVARVEYALEADANPSNVDYVRTPYGALVRGQSVCEGYARALKAVLDRLGMENVLVQGAYVDDKGVPQPHMWNYVRMDDNRWYLLDTTMEDGNPDTGDEFFLISLADMGILKNYQPSGIISLGQNSIEFNYPALSAATYQELSTTFTADANQISYKGMGLAKTKDTLGLEIVGSHDGKNWYYVWNHIIVGLYDMGYGLVTPAQLGMDTDTSFMNFHGYAYVGVTQIAAPESMGTETPTPAQRREFSVYSGGIANIRDLAKVGEVTEYDAIPPYVASKSPNTQLKPGQSYRIKAVYSESLALSNKELPADIQWVTPVEGASFANFTWDGDRTVEFDLTTSTSYGYTTYYYFDLVNLVSREKNSIKPDPICYTVVNYPSFDCPKVSWDYSNIHSNIPALIDDTNLAENGWTDENGQSIGNYASSRLALVASELPQENIDAMEDAIEGINGGEKVLASKTYDISLSLCSNMVNYITGNRVKVFVPFPAGYNAQSNVSFKAYHFKPDGTPEQIDCVTTESGIIMMCDAFSPFAVVATEKEPVSQRQVMTFASGNGTFSQELVTVRPGQPQAITVRADSGYRIDRVLLNGEPIQSTGKVRTTSDTTTITLNYDALKDSGNVLEATFVLKDISTDPVPEVFAELVSNYTAAVVNAPEAGWQEGRNTFTVTGSQKFLVALTQDNGASYTLLHGEAVDGGYAYTADLTLDSRLAVVLLGDANLDGKVTTADVARINAAVLKKQTATALGLLVFDVNMDGKLSTADVAKLNAVILGKAQL